MKLSQLLPGIALLGGIAQAQSPPGPPAQPRSSTVSVNDITTVLDNEDRAPARVLLQGILDRTHNGADPVGLDNGRSVAYPELRQCIKVYLDYAEARGKCAGEQVPMKAIMCWRHLSIEQSRLVGRLDVERCGFDYPRFSYSAIGKEQADAIATLQRQREDADERASNETAARQREAAEEAQRQASAHLQDAAAMRQQAETLARKSKSGDFFDRYQALGELCQLYNDRRSGVPTSPYKWTPNTARFDSSALMTLANGENYDKFDRFKGTCYATLWASPAFGGPPGLDRVGTVTSSTAHSVTMAYDARIATGLRARAGQALIAHFVGTPSVPQRRYLLPVAIADGYADLVTKFNEPIKAPRFTVVAILAFNGFEAGPRREIELSQPVLITVPGMLEKLVNPREVGLQSPPTAAPPSGGSVACGSEGWRPFQGAIAEVCAEGAPKRDKRDCVELLAAFKECKAGMASLDPVSAADLSRGKFKYQIVGDGNLWEIMFERKGARWVAASVVYGGAE